MKNRNAYGIAALLLGLINLFFGISANAAIVIDTVFVGDAGNPSDTTGYGSVSYGYYIGTYEVTNAQYAMFNPHPLCHPLRLAPPKSKFLSVMGDLFTQAKPSGSYGLLPKHSLIMRFCLKNRIARFRDFER